MGGHLNKVALITGISGQDGSYLAEQLFDRGYEVHGLIRRASTFNTSRLANLYVSTELAQKIYLHYLEGFEGLHLYNLIENIQPSEIYNLSAQSHVAVSFEQPNNALLTIGSHFLHILETVKKLELDCKIYQASTSEMYGSTPPPQNEKSIFAPRSPYAAAKLYSHNLAKIYRDAFGMHISTGILFNHESPRRGRMFVTRKISTAVAEIVQGKRDYLKLGNLKAFRDWGYAPEYTDAMWRILQLKDPVDLVIATGTQYSVADFCEFAFSHVGLDWKKHVEVSSQFERALEVESLLGDPALAKQIIGWSPNVLAPELAKIMVDADLEKDRYEY